MLTETRQDGDTSHTAEKTTHTAKNDNPANVADEVGWNFCQFSLFSTRTEDQSTNYVEGGPTATPRSWRTKLDSIHATSERGTQGGTTKRGHGTIRETRETRGETTKQTNQAPTNQRETKAKQGRDNEETRGGREEGGEKSI